MKIIIGLMVLIILIFIGTSCSKVVVEEIMVEEVVVAAEEVKMEEELAVEEVKIEEEIMVEEEVVAEEVMNEEVKIDLEDSLSLYNDPVLKYLGWEKRDILDLFGEPDIQDSIGGPGGEFLYYEKENISFIFAGFDEVVNNLDLFPGAKVLGIEVGMTFGQIEEIWGEPFYRGWDDYIGSYTIIYWLGEIREEEMLAEIEMYFDASADDAPTEFLGIRWKKYWW